MEKTTSTEVKTEKLSKEKIDEHNKNHHTKMHGGETPIDCPMRKHGIDPHKMKPFDKTEKYIEFLERKDRENWQNPDDIIKKLSLKGDEKIADVGAGSGYFSFRFAEKLKTGKVYAIDVEPEMIRHIHHKSMTRKIQNIDAIIAEYNDPKVPGDSDIVFICDVLHHVKKRAEWLKKLHSEMKRGAKLVIIEFKEGKLPQGPPESLKISKEELYELIEAAGFKKVSEDTKILPYQYFLEFIKK